MAKVFNGKVSIPGDKIDEYFEAMKKAEEERAPFKTYLECLRDDFYDSLLEKYTENTANKHTCTITMFIEFLCRQTDVMSIEEITKGIANTHFRSWYKRKVWDSATDNDLKIGINKFFQFLEKEKGIENHKVLPKKKT
jgi:site-specific recombinase XerD